VHLLSSVSDDGSKEKLEEFHEDCAWDKRGLDFSCGLWNVHLRMCSLSTKTSTSEQVNVEKNSVSTVTTKTTVVTASRGWRNVFSLPISYDVNVVPYGTLLDPTNLQLLESTGVHPEGYNRRFAVIDAAVDTIYGDKIRAYFSVSRLSSILSSSKAENLLSVLR
jgi:hypothetical protein